MEAVLLHTNKNFGAILAWLKSTPFIIRSLWSRFLTFIRHGPPQLYTYPACTTVASNLSTGAEDASAHCTSRFDDHDRWKAFYACWVHVLPLVITSVLLESNFRTRYYEDAGAPG